MSWMTMKMKCHPEKEATVQVTNLEDEADRRKAAAGCSNDRDKHSVMSDFQFSIWKGGCGNSV